MDELFEVGEKAHSHETSSSVSTTDQPSFLKEGSRRRRRSARRLYSNTRVMGLPALPFTAVEDDSYVAPAREVLA